MKMRDLTGMRFGRLVAICPSGTTRWKNIKWRCLCDCGNETTVASGKLIRGTTQSCGCYSHELHVKQLEKHGFTTGGKPRTFIIWCGMKSRCYYPKSINYPAYGGRGIRICEEWLTFENFHRWAISNGYQDDLTIDRIDNDSDYCPENCHWIPSKENRKKQRRARYFSIKGEIKNITDWCKLVRLSKSTAYKYLHQSEDSFVKEVERRLRGKEAA